MSRFYEKISEEELRARLGKLSAGDEEYDEDYPNSLNVGQIIEKLGKDVKVRFDLENTYWSAGDNSHFPLLGFQELNGMPFWGFAGGGDWEHPVFFIVYWDGKKLRGYVPTDGNVFNGTTMEAYGNSGEDDAKDLLKKKIISRDDFDKYKENDFCFDRTPDLDWDKIKADIKGRILKRK